MNNIPAHAAVDAVLCNNTVKESSTTQDLLQSGSLGSNPTPSDGIAYRLAGGKLLVLVHSEDQLLLYQMSQTGFLQILVVLVVRMQLKEPCTVA